MIFIDINGTKVERVLLEVNNRLVRLPKFIGVIWLKIKKIRRLT